MPDKKLTDAEIKKALEERIKDLPCVHEKYEPACGMWCEHLHMWCIDFNNKSLKENCSEYKPCCSMSLEKQVLDLFNRLQAEKNDLFYKLTGVMYSVDKWLDGDELKENEVNRAATMREKTLQIVESLQAENARLKTQLYLEKYTDVAKKTIKSEAYKEFAERLKKKSFDVNSHYDWVVEEKDIDNLLKELERKENTTYDD